LRPIGPFEVGFEVSFNIRLDVGLGEIPGEYQNDEEKELDPTSAAVWCGRRRSFA
jgi:hypothetical protein